MAVIEKQIMGKKFALKFEKILNINKLAFENVFFCIL
jgi:hypothetical protein